MSDDLKWLLNLQHPWDRGGKICDTLSTISKLDTLGVPIIKLTDKKNGIITRGWVAYEQDDVFHLDANVRELLETSKNSRISCGYQISELLKGEVVLHVESGGGHPREPPGYALLLLRNNVLIEYQYYSHENNMIAFFDYSLGYGINTFSYRPPYEFFQKVYLVNHPNIKMYTFENSDDNALAAYTYRVCYKHDRKQHSKVVIHNDFLEAKRRVQIYRTQVLKYLDELLPPCLCGIIDSYLFYPHITSEETF
jgi:hypothetical protein